MSAALIYHLARAPEWAVAEQSGIYHGAAEDRRDGFLHFSAGEHIRESAARHRSGEAGLLVVEVRAADLGEALKWEISRNGIAFPHLYGPLTLQAVTRTAPLPLDEAGQHIFPDWVV